MKTLPRRRNAAIFAGMLALASALLALGRFEIVTGADDKPYVDEHYPDFEFLPPPNVYKGRVFVLSQKYPGAEPDRSQRPAFLTIDFKTQWHEYLLAAQDYCFRDNVG